jgi:Zn finger protein HypA/HybF involved in hydrogenase expression
MNTNISVNNSIMSDIKCPKCGSTQIHADKRGFKAGRAVAGTLIAGPLAGLATGGAGKNKVIITCLGCGHQFKPGEGSSLGGSTYSGTNNYPEGVAFVRQERGNYKCAHCGKVSSFEEANKRCPSCGGYIKESDRIGYVKPTATTKESGASSGLIVAIVMILAFILVLVMCS